MSIDIVSLLSDAVKVGLAVAEIIPWAKQRHPELRTDPMPDAAGAMYAAREAAIHRAYQGEIRAAVAAGDMRGQRAEDAIARARAAVPDSPEAAEVYGERLGREITIDGVPVRVGNSYLTYAGILSFAGYHPDEAVSVMYRIGDSGGVVPPNGVVTAIDGMRISTSRTGAS